MNKLNAKTVGVGVVGLALFVWIFGISALLVGTVMLGVGLTYASNKPIKALQSGNVARSITQRQFP